MKERTIREDVLWSSAAGWIGINLLIALVTTFFNCPVCAFSLESWGQMYAYFILSFLISFALSYGSYWFENFFDKRMPWIRVPLKRLVFQVSSYLLYSFCAVYAVLVLYIVLVEHVYELDRIPWKGLVGDSKQAMLIALVISVVFISRSFLYEWRESALEAEQLKSERLAQQYQSLKDQLNPHFLFNSLNVLSSLVYEQPDTAEKLIHQLSRIYRYVLEVQQEQLVHLQREMEFAQNYLSLQKIRFEQGLQFTIQENISINRYLPPLSLQLLLENAVKHNTASQNNPLIIEILVEGNDLVVKNNLQPKRQIWGESLGIGLDNIQKRYALLGEENIKVCKEQGYFVVKLPLVKLDEEYQD
jgi:sensor histidine kinase YesM